MFERIVPIFDRFSSINRCISIFHTERVSYIYFHSKKYFIFYNILSRFFFGDKNSVKLKIDLVSDSIF